jgi:hypothetical protein
MRFDTKYNDTWYILWFNNYDLDNEFLNKYDKILKNKQVYRYVILLMDW